MCINCGNNNCQGCSGKGCGHGCTMSKVAKWLLVVGGLNWGLIGLGMLFSNGESWNLVSILFGAWPVLEAIIYVLVGVSAVVSICGCKCKTCKDGVCNTCAPVQKVGNTETKV